tara:strand:- start:220 stop:384 length:165 start_codon:yes stop_codon:yes gene_type:complete
VLRPLTPLQRLLLLLPMELLPVTKALLERLLPLPDPPGTRVRPRTPLSSQMTRV